MKTTTTPWARFSRVRGFLWVLYGLFPIAIGAVAVMDQHPNLYRTKVTLALGYFAALAILQSALPFWPCPHCGKAFFGGWRSDAFLRFFVTKGRKCANCGLPWRDGSER